LLPKRTASLQVWKNAASVLCAAGKEQAASSGAPPDEELEDPAEHDLRRPANSVGESV
jgi:hypothetical protein